MSEYPVALITGASRGIGKAVALQLQCRHNLALAARNEDLLNEVVHQTKTDDPTAWAWKNWNNIQVNGEPLDKAKQKTIAYPGDLTDVAEAKRLVDAVIADFGRLDVIVNNAALYTKATIDAANLANWDEELDLNLRAIIHLCYHAAPYLKETQGAIINVGSIAAHRSYKGGASYCASKWGLLGFTQSLFYDLRDYRIKVCCISPGYVNTDMNSQKALNHKELIQPSDIAQAVQFILDYPANACPVEITIQPQLTP